MGARHLSHMGTQNLILFLLVGIAAGWLAGKIMKGSGYGLVGDLVVGVVGAFVGVWVLGLLGISSGGILGLLLASIVGALLFLYVLRLFNRR
jgi:uncharacterized membrane protein YeaQ/YmgE (transglycosylase-associated protein family)